MRVQPTPDVVNKKHLNFGQGLEFLKVGQGNRGLNQQNHMKNKGHHKKQRGETREIDKTTQDRDS